MLARIAKKYTLRLWPWYLGGLLALGVTNAATLAIPYWSKLLVDGIQAGLEDVGSLQKLALAIIGLGFLQMFVRAISRILIFWPGRQTEYQLKNDLYSHILNLPAKTLDRFGLGDLISRLANDVSHMRILFAFGFLQIANLVFLTVFTLFQMVRIHPWLTLWALLPLTFMLLIAQWIMPWMHTISLRQQESIATLTNRITDAFLNVQTVKLQGAEDAFVERAEKENLQVLKDNMEMVKIRNLMWPLLMTLHNASALVVLVYGGLQVIAGALTVGDILAFNIYISYLAFPITAFGIVMGVLQRARTAAVRMHEMQSLETEADLVRHASTDLQAFAALGDKKNTAQRAPLLKVQNLSFAYAERRENTRDESMPPHVLTGVSFEVFAGQKTGIFGPVASGKTTLLQILTRIFDPKPGQVYWKGQDILTMDQSNLRSAIFHVEQEAKLLSTTVLENAKLGAAGDLTLEQIENAAKKSAFLPELKILPYGWQTQVGEKGAQLSGGQRQRLALTRAFLRRPDLVLLDDVLSAVDSITEKQMLEHLLAIDSAVFFVSSRPAVLASCDRLLIFNEAGHITAQGTPAEVWQNLPEAVRELTSPDQVFKDSEESKELRGAS